MRSGAQSARRREFRDIAAGARELANFRKTEQVGDDGLAAPVLVGAVGMQSVATAARFEIDQRRRQIIGAEKPRKGALRIDLPFGVAVGAPRREAGRDRRGRLQRLLIERRGAASACRRSSSSRRA